LGQKVCDFALAIVVDPRISFFVVDIIDGNLKLILGMIWTLILRFTIADIRYLSTLHVLLFLSEIKRRGFIGKRRPAPVVSTKNGAL